jgi:hypothetical protein
VARLGETRNAYKNFRLKNLNGREKERERENIWKTSSMWEDNVKMDLKRKMA